VEPRVPIIVGGRSAAAVRRAARLGDGYIGIWISAKRFSSVAAEIAREAAACGREQVDWQHAMFVWCGMGERRDDARRQVADAMQGVYRIGFERFERYTPFGTPADVADFLAPYVEAGCRRFNLAGVAESDEALIAHAAEVKRLLNK
jgi:alkanesulfonate monooxygenase SsuD/methylene tetrahydromethanopterin reductase-like flavin-dependent oxidoreductase (luciferase family)